MSLCKGLGLAFKHTKASIHAAYIFIDNAQTSTDDEIVQVNRPKSRTTSYQFDCGCDKCTVVALKERPCPRPKQCTQSAVHPISPSLARRLSGDQLEAQVQYTEKIIKKFRTNMFETLMAIKKEEIDAFTLGLFIHINLDKTDKANFPEEPSYGQIIRFLSNVCSWYQFDLIEDMAQNFLPPNHKSRDCWVEYRSELREYAHFCRDRILNHDENVVVIEMDEKYQDINIKEDIPKLRATLAKCLKIDRTTLHFITALERPQEVIFHSPDSVIATSISLLGEEFKATGITSVTYQSANSSPLMKLPTETVSKQQNCDARCHLGNYYT